MGRARHAVTHGWRRLGSRLGRADRVVLVAVLAVVAGGWSFLAVADAVTGGAPGHTEQVVR